MKSNDIQEAMQNLDEEIVNEARKNKRNRKIKKITVISSTVSCFLVVAIIVGLFAGKALLNNSTEDSGYLENAGDNSSDSSKIVSDIPGVFSRKSSGSEEALYVGDGDRKLMYSKDASAEAIFPSAFDGEKYISDASNAQISAGTLTAGEWKDRNFFENWQKIVNDNEWYKYAETRLLFSNKMVKVSVLNGEKACFNCTVKLLEGETVLYSAKTDAEGKAYLFYNTTVKENHTPDAVEVEGVKYDLSSKNEITVQLQNSNPITKLDLMFMVDTTGSMSDELSYICAEMADIVARIEKNNQFSALRLSMNFYRDTTDVYIVDSHPFTSDIKEIQTILNNSDCNGGGDYPEAVHTALNDAVNNHEWDDDAVKICFLILDAPPHDDAGISNQIRKTIETAAEKGIRIIPVLCSGADQETEYLCRSYALMTGGSFVFLTDDSGIGGSHITPTDTDSDVEKLNDCIVRIVSEYCGYTASKK